MHRTISYYLFGLLIACVFGANAQDYNSYCRQSGVSNVNASCFPARESAWVYRGGTFNWQVQSGEQGSPDAVKAAIESGINSKFPDYCSPASVSFEGGWLIGADNAGSRQESMTMRITVGNKFGDSCETASGTNGNSIDRVKTYTCPTGSPGPFSGPGNSRFCVKYCERCSKTPHPILISGGVKSFGPLYDAPSFQDMHLYRSYSSLPSYSGPGLLNPPRTELNTSNWRFLGDTTGWQLSYDARLVRTATAEDTSVVYTVDIPGDVPNSYLLASDGSLQRRQNNSSSLVKLTDGRFLYKRSDATLWVFGVDLRLAAVGRSTGGLVTLDYTGGRLSAATNHFGRRLQIGYGTSNVVESIIDSSGSAYGYQFDSNARLVGISFPGDSGSSVLRQYLYENTSYPGAITGEIDEKGVQFSSYTYDQDGRATDSVMYAAAGTPVEHYRIDHSASSAPKVTDPNGAVRTYSFTTGGGQGILGGLSQPAANGSPAANTAVIVDSNGNPLAVNDLNGYRTCMFYDASRALATVSVEGLGQYASCAGYDTSGVTLPAGSRKTSKQWHPDWRLETKVAEPGRITTSVYNGQPDPFNGNAIASCAPSTALLPDGKRIAVLCKRVEQATTDANGAAGFSATLQSGVVARTWKWTYNEYGQVLTEDGPRTDVTDVTTYAYYTDTTADHTKGDLQQVTNAVGKITQYTKYNKHGQVLESVDPNGVLTVNTYDLRQRLLSTTVGGQTTGYTYDPVGQLKRVTLPDTTYVGYDYDDAHRLVAVYDHLGNRTTYELDNAGNRTSEKTTDPTNQLKRQLDRSIDALGRVQQTTGRE